MSRNHTTTLIRQRRKLKIERKSNENFKLQGILEIKLSKKMGKDVYKFLPMTDNMPMKPKSISMDPLERNQIYIGTSQLNGMSFGDGVFAKRAIPGIIYIPIRASQIF